jgi:hypothetical protein
VRADTQRQPLCSWLGVTLRAASVIFICDYVIRKQVLGYRCGQKASLTGLQEKGLPVNAEDKLGWTAVMYASLSDQVRLRIDIMTAHPAQTETTELLLENFANTQPRAGGWNPLIVAATAGNRVDTSNSITTCEQIQDYITKHSY